MQNKTIVITGATSGIGEVAAVALARMGTRLIMTARDSARAEAALSAVRAAGPERAHRVVYGDFEKLADMKRAGAEIAAAEAKIDVLINNAGAMFGKRRETADGLEAHFAVNHMAYFVLTNALLPALQAAPGARIISTASDAHAVGKLDFDDLQLRWRYASFSAYGASKLCNVLWTRELSRRLAGTA